MWYGNEEVCGQAILEFCKQTGVPRSDIFYTTKLGSNDGFALSREAIQTSVDKCGLGYIDLYLIHTPEGGATARRESWQAICAAQREGLLKSIGISNFGVKHMEEFLDVALPMPVLNQVRVMVPVLIPTQASIATSSICIPSTLGLRSSHFAINTRLLSG
jgi:diketogulonate reductase-like aldo/keto reductase